MITTFLVVLVMQGQPHIIQEHREALACRTQAAERNERAQHFKRRGWRFHCIAWTRPQ
jgi:hypothetical protein